MCYSLKTIFRLKCFVHFVIVFNRKGSMRWASTLAKAIYTGFNSNDGATDIAHKQSFPYHQCVFSAHTTAAGGWCRRMQMKFAPLARKRHCSPNTTLSHTTQAEVQSQCAGVVPLLQVSPVTYRSSPKVTPLNIPPARTPLSTFELLKKISQGWKNCFTLGCHLSP